MLLSNSEEEKVYEIVSIEEGKMSRLKLSARGIIPGAYLKIIKNDKKGPIIIGLNTMRMSIGRGLCNKIYVEEI